MTVEEFWTQHGRDRGVELVHGQVRQPAISIVTRIGREETNALVVFDEFLSRNPAVGRFWAPAHVRTAPGTVRVAHLAFWGAHKAPAEASREGPIAAPPDLVLEGRSAGERWLGRFTRMVEYLRAEVAVVLLLDAVTTAVCAYRPNAPPQVFEPGTTVTVPDVLPGFEVPVARFFEE